MRQVTRKGLITVAAAGGVLALGGGYAQADSGADGTAANSPGVLSGNNVQVPVHVPVNVCGNTANVVGVLNPAMGNRCANTSDGAGGSHGGKGHTDAPGKGGSHAGGGTGNSPGVGSGNVIEVPIDVPVNVCGNSVDVVGALNPTMGNGCENADTPAPPTEHKPETPGTPKPPRTAPSRRRPTPRTPRRRRLSPHRPPPPRAPRHWPGPGRTDSDW